MRALWILVILVASSLAAQNRIKPPEQGEAKIHRATVTDESGLQQWAPFKKERCPTCVGQKQQECEFCKRLKDPTDCPSCDGDRKAPCRTCFGTGQTWDPLEIMPCAGCGAEGMIPCPGCGSRGVHMVEGGGDKPKKCDACRGARVFECKACKGERFLEVVRPKKALAEDELADLMKTREAIAEVRTELAAWTGDDRRSKAVKSFEKIVKPVKKQLPATKDITSTLDAVLKGLDKARMWQGTAQKIADQQAAFRDRTIWMLDHSVRLLDRCIERAEANAAVATTDKK